MIYEEFSVEVWTVDGLKEFSVCPAHTTRWTVGAVHSAKFPSLDYASYERHDRVEDEIN